MQDGKRRFGNPRTNEERRKRHTKLYGKGSKLPPRGTGILGTIKGVKSAK